MHKEADVSSEAELTQYFKDSLTKYMEESNLLAKTPNSADASISIVIDYFRKFNIGGKALNRPEVSHYVIAEKNGEKLASFGVSNYTTKYGYLKDAAVNFEMAAFQWDKNDEKEEDIDLISKILAKDISGLGN